MIKYNYVLAFLDKGEVVPDNAKEVFYGTITERELEDVIKYSSQKPGFIPIEVRYKIIKKKECDEYQYEQSLNAQGRQEILKRMGSKEKVFTDLPKEKTEKLVRVAVYKPSKGDNNMKKIIAGIITYLISGTIVLTIAVPAVTKIILLTFCGIAIFGLLGFIYWLILQILDWDNIYVYTINTYNS